jgi:hypothetical protein
MIVLSIIALIVAIAALVLVVILWKTVAAFSVEASKNEQSLERLATSVLTLVKKVNGLSVSKPEKPVEPEKTIVTIDGLDNIVTFANNTVTISANLDVKGWVTAGERKEE